MGAVLLGFARLLRWRSKYPAECEFSMQLVGFFTVLTLLFTVEKIVIAAPCLPFAGSETQILNGYQVEVRAQVNEVGVFLGYKMTLLSRDPKLPKGYFEHWVIYRDSSRPPASFEKQVICTYNEEGDLEISAEDSQFLIGTQKNVPLEANAEARSGLRKRRFVIEGREFHLPEVEKDGVSYVFGKDLFNALIALDVLDRKISQSDNFYVLMRKYLHQISVTIGDPLYSYRPTFAHGAVPLYSSEELETLLKTQPTVFFASTKFKPLESSLKVFQIGNARFELQELQIENKPYILGADLHQALIEIDELSPVERPSHFYKRLRALQIQSLSITTKDPLHMRLKSTGYPYLRDRVVLLRSDDFERLCLEKPLAIRSSAKGIPSSNEAYGSGHYRFYLKRFFIKDDYYVFGRELVSNLQELNLVGKDDPNRYYPLLRDKIPFLEVTSKDPDYSALTALSTERSKKFVLFKSDEFQKAFENNPRFLSAGAVRFPQKKPKRVSIVEPMPGKKPRILEKTNQ